MYIEMSKRPIIWNGGITFFFEAIDGGIIEPQPIYSTGKKNKHGMHKMKTSQIGDALLEEQKAKHL